MLHKTMLFFSHQEAAEGVEAEQDGDDQREQPMPAHSSESAHERVQTLRL